MMKPDPIVFFCLFCGQKIALRHATGGLTVKCPACRRTIPVPLCENGLASDASNAKDPASDTATGGTTPGNDAESSKPATTQGSIKRIVIPKGMARNGVSGRTPPPADTPPQTKSEAHDRSLIILGGVCLVGGALFAALLPGAVFIHITLFATALLSAFLCITRRMVLIGALLLIIASVLVQWMELPLIRPLLRRLASPAKSATPSESVLPVTKAKQTDVDRKEPAPIQPVERRPVRAPMPGAIAENLPPLAPAPVPPSIELPEEESKEALRASTPLPEEAVQPALKSEPSEPGKASVEEPAYATTEPPTPPVAPGLTTLRPGFPLVVYSDCSEDMPYYPSGWMGYIDAIDFDDCWEDNPHEGRTCIRLAYNATYYWGGIAWQMPPNNWGDENGGFDLSEATCLTFWARAEREGTIAEFKVGIRSPGPFADTGTATTGKRKLTRQWKPYKIPLKGRNLSRIISGFVCVVEGAEMPPIIYIDDVQYESGNEASRMNLRSARFRPR